MSIVRRKLPEWMTNSSNATELCPELLFPGKINYCYSIEDITSTSDKILNHLDCSEDLVQLGFDSEWPIYGNTGSGKTAVIQICPSEEICHIIHVYNIYRLPKVLFEIIQHPKVKLVGLNIKNDIWKLGRDFRVSVQHIVENGCLDLAVFARNVLHTTQSWSLANLTQHLLKQRLNKADEIRKSDWSKPLSETQKIYAATDAYASLMCYLKLAELQSSSSSRIIS